MARSSTLHLVCIVLMLMFAAMLAAAQSPAGNSTDASALHAAEQQLEAGRSTRDEATLLAARNTFEQCLHLNANAHCAYSLASAEFYLAQAKESHNDKKGAEHWLDSASDDAKHAIALDDRSSDAHALLADIYGKKIGFGGMFAGMHYGPKANAETQRALELDPNNPRAYAVLGRKYLYAPKMFGGDLPKAIESFQKATSLDPHYDEAFVWLAIAYRKAGQEQQARTAVAEALRLNPQSAFAQEIQAGTKLQ
jgi:tetratricopeptide (TPR) repeat protein